MKGLKEGGYNFLIHNKDLIKNDLAFIKMLQLRLQYQMKVKLLDWDKTNSFCVHHIKEDVVISEDIDNLFYLFHKILPIHEQREVKIKKQFEKSIPGAKNKFKTADILIKLQPRMVDMNMCGIANVPATDSD